MQVYSDAHMASRFAGPIWDKVAKENKAFAKFGRFVLSELAHSVPTSLLGVEVLHQEF